MTTSASDGVCSITRTKRNNNCDRLSVLKKIENTYLNDGLDCRVSYDDIFKTFKKRT